MKLVADFHIHSKYSRAVSRDMTLEVLDATADDKGIKVMGTGDFTHPEWFKEIKNKLEPAEPGLFRLKDKFKIKTLKGTLAETRFMLSAEISSIYSRGEKTRRVHNLIFAPDIETVEKINKELSLVGNLKSDGRPIIGIDSEDLLKIALEANPRSFFVPAHIWTPWFSVFGSMSGFDSLEECFGENTKYIFAVETGLSSDPLMNWRCSQLDKVALISNSDSHSPARIGREANVFDCELSYYGIIEAIKSGRPSFLRHPDSPASEEGSRFKRGILRKAQNDDGRNGAPFLETIEFFPEEGRYHFDGHRLCGISWTPEETAKRKGICSKCGQKVTVGVLNRVARLADRPSGYTDEFRVPFRNLVTLDGIIGEALDLGVKTKTVANEYEKLIVAFGSELAVLTEVKLNELSLATKPEIAEGIERVRAGKLKIKPGYDGEYGEIKIFNGKEREKFKAQSLF